MKKNLCMYFPFVVVVLLLVGCRTAIPVQITEPPQLDYCGAKIIGVLPFGTASEDAQATSKDLETYFSWWESRELNADLELASYLTSKIESVLASTDYFTVISSQELQRQIANENEDTSFEVIVTGQISSVFEDMTNELVAEKDKNGKEIKVRYWTREVQITFTLNILDKDDLSIIDSLEYRKSVLDTEDDRSSLKSEEALRISCIDAMVDDIKYELIPKTYTDYRKMMELADNKDPRIERIDSLLDGEFYSDAYDLYVEIYEETNDMAALYNSILLIEVMGMYDDALEKMTNLAKETGNKDAIDQMNRMTEQANGRAVLAQ